MAVNDLLTTPMLPHSLVDEAVRRLEHAIFSGALPPGAKLSEPDLARQMGVSRGPLREALRRLEGRHLIHRTPNIGARVALLSEEGLADLLVAREALEGAASRLAAERMTDQEIAELEILLGEHAQQKSVREGTGYFQETRDWDFHFRIIRGSRNGRLVSMLCEDLYDLLRIYRFQGSRKPGRAQQALWEHRLILTAIKSRDGDAAEAAMRLHIRNARVAHMTRPEDQARDPAT